MSEFIDSCEQDWTASALG